MLNNILANIGEMFLNLWNSLGLNNESVGWQNYVMILISFILMYLAIVKKFEPLLLMPIAFGMLLANLPGANLMHMEMFFDDYYLNISDGVFAHQFSQWFAQLLAG